MCGACLSRRRLLAALAAAPLAACSENLDTGRNQLILVDDAQLAGLADQAWGDLAAKTPRLADPEAQARVARVGAGIAGATGRTDLDWGYEVFDAPDSNAFVLPNGKVAVFRGLLEAVRSDDELAAVMGHEAGHVVARHAAERVSQQLAIQAGVSLVQILLSDQAGESADAIAGALGMGALYGVILPYSRKHELEADALGLTLMEKAGHDPVAAVAFWERRIAESRGQGGVPEVLSTHPADATRLARLREAVAGG
ncbi:MAG: M48 family metallopeptidase [Phenylobacterium sp.]|nr:M48 family metallopeptidase [Phenylobacterium sp.]